MARHLLLVHTNPSIERDEAYNAWYDHVHIPEVLALPGFLGVQRFQVSGRLPGRSKPFQEYLAMYELETDDVGQTLERLHAAIPTMNVSEDLDLGSVHAFTISALGPRIESGQEWEE
jgi:hypothetical protein